MTFSRLFNFAVVMAVSGGLYLVLGYLFKVEEIMTLVQKVKRRLTRKP